MTGAEDTFNPSDRIQLKSDPGRKGHLTGKVRQQSGVTKVLKDQNLAADRILLVINIQLVLLASEQFKQWRRHQILVVEPTPIQFKTLRVFLGPI